MRAVVW